MSIKDNGFLFLVLSCYHCSVSSRLSLYIYLGRRFIFQFSLKITGASHHTVGGNVANRYTGALRCKDALPLMRYEYSSADRRKLYQIDDLLTSHLRVPRSAKERCLSGLAWRFSGAASPELYSEIRSYI